MMTDPYKIDFLNKCRIRDGLPGGWLSSDEDRMNGSFLILYEDLIQVGSWFI